MDYTIPKKSIYHSKIFSFNNPLICSHKYIAQRLLQLKNDDPIIKLNIIIDKSIEEWRDIRDKFKNNNHYYDKIYDKPQSKYLLQQFIGTMADYMYLRSISEERDLSHLECFNFALVDWIKMVESSNTLNYNTRMIDEIARISSLEKKTLE